MVTPILLPPPFSFLYFFSFFFLDQTKFGNRCCACWNDWNMRTPIIIIIITSSFSRFHLLRWFYFLFLSLLFPNHLFLPLSFLFLSLYNYLLNFYHYLLSFTFIPLPSTLYPLPLPFDTYVHAHTRTHSHFQCSFYTLFIFFFFFPYFFNLFFFS